MKMMELGELKAFYTDHLFNTLVPFWMEEGIDWEKGGFFTCFSNDCERLVSTNKYVWSQGRFLWMLSRLAHEFGSYSDRYSRKAYLDAATCGAVFLKERALLENGHAAWALNREGKPIAVDRLGNVVEGGELERGITADIFLIYGMGEYARAAGKREFFDFALTLFKSVDERFRTNTYRWVPQAVPQGYRSHALSMIMLETAQELAAIAAYFKDPAEEQLLAISQASAETTVRYFLDEDEQRLFEFVKESGASAFDELLASTINPGHALEDAWFMLHWAMRSKDRKILNAGLKVVRWMTEIGAANEEGGIPQFMHKDGGRPRGAVLPIHEGTPVVTEIRENWYNRLWWVHSEALYALLLAYELSGDEEYLDLYWPLHEYVFSTFPNPDKEKGEWIQIRDQWGRPEDKVVALPVKDPYHITRAFMHAIKSLERILGRQK
ncbi:MAG: AGE family epimerase/isomerase [Spirochaetota bacterium]|nr:AGE family epimerase/isomerase [Spirochaetota bacterium]